MVLCHGNAHSESAKIEQIIGEFFAKSLHIILESRTPYMSSRDFYQGDESDSSPCTSSSASSGVKPKDKWFSLALRERPNAFENVNSLDSFVIDVILVHKSVDWDPMIPKRVFRRNLSMQERCELYCNGQELGIEGKSERILERWFVQYENRKIMKDSNSGIRRLNNNSMKNLYKPLNLLLRSLYATVRLLPAYKTFKHLSSPAPNSPFTLSHRVSSFVEPFTRKQESEMMKFSFTPVDTSSGRVFLEVMYRPSTSDLRLDTLPMYRPSTSNLRPDTLPSLSPSLSQQVISNYVGNPFIDPFRKFTSLPLAGIPCRRVSPYSRRHSWNFDDRKASSTSITESSLCKHSESQILVSNRSSQLFPLGSLPPHLAEMSSMQKKDSSLSDCYYPSSPSIYKSCYSSASKILLQSESASVSISNAEVVYSSGYSEGHILPPGSSRRTYKIDKRTSMTSMMQGATVEKVKDEAHKYFGVRISANRSPCVSISSRSYQDDFDDSDIRCPFDYDDMTDPKSRTESLDHGLMAEARDAEGFFPIRKSNDAAIGALVHMLNKAPPLHQDLYKPKNVSVQKPKKEDLSNYARCETRNNYIQELNQNQEASIPVNIMSSGIISTRKTTSDALKEFHGYREMKNLLVMRDSKPQI